MKILLWVNQRKNKHQLPKLTTMKQRRAGHLVQPNFAISEFWRTQLDFLANQHLVGFWLGSSPWRRWWWRWGGTTPWDLVLATTISNRLPTTHVSHSILEMLLALHQHWPKLIDFAVLILYVLDLNFVVLKWLHRINHNGWNIHWFQDKSQQILCLIRIKLSWSVDSLLPGVDILIFKHQAVEHTVKLMFLRKLHMMMHRFGGFMWNQTFMKICIVCICKYCIVNKMFDLHISSIYIIIYILYIFWSKNNQVSSESGRSGFLITQHGSNSLALCDCNCFLFSMTILAAGSPYFSTSHALLRMTWAPRFFSCRLLFVLR